MHRRLLVLGLLVGTVACGDVNAALEHLLEARRLTSDLQVQFAKAADAASRAVMAEADETSTVAAAEAATATQAVQADIVRLGPVLEGLHATDEQRLLKEFVGRFDAYRALDGRILELAVQNTNLKARRLAFGPAQDAADAFRDALAPIVSAVPPRDEWRAKALVATAVLTVREIQVLQSPHIADAEDAAMTRMEGRMATSEVAARTSLAALAGLVPASSRPQVAAATAALDTFVGLNAEIIALSRRNTNVRSLALSLEQKPALVASCEASLRALHDALAKRGYNYDRFR